MKHPKPILVIKQKCKGCDGTKEQLGMAGQTEDSMFLTMQICEVCKGVGEQKMKITPLRDFKKCDCTCHNRIIESHRGKHYNYIDCTECKGNYIIPKEYELEIHRSKHYNYIDCTKCKGTDYIIPKEYEPYEIKEVREITESEICEWMQVPRLKEQSWMPSFLTKLDLKEDDKVMVRTR